jgi:hypothetical protein
VYNVYPKAHDMMMGKGKGAREYEVEDEGG